jgi:putative addiction module killer protein
MIDKKTAVFSKWFNKLPDNAQDEIKTYVGRVLTGNISNCKGVGNGVCELTIDYQKGYRVYYTVVANKLILLLLNGGTKGGNQKQQQKDIALAKEIKEYLKNKGAI